MKIMQVITDYIAKSILTTKGDIVVRGVSIPERLPVEANNNVLTCPGGGDPPLYRFPQVGMTTLGDLTTRGASSPERLAAVAVGQVLKSAGVSTKPAWGIPFILGADMATGEYTFGSTGDEVVTGLGFKPGVIVFFARDEEAAGLGWSVGFDNGGFSMVISAANDDGIVSSGLGKSISVERTIGNYLWSAVSTKGANGFTVTHTLTGTIVVNVCWFAIG